MKKLLISKLSLTVLLLTSTTAFAHTGHISNEAVHSFLHAEHVIAIAGIGLIAYIAVILRNR